MAKRQDLTNRRFGKLVVISGHGSRTDGLATILECKCDCGRTCHTTRRLLVDDEMNSCWHCPPAPRPRRGQVVHTPEYRLYYSLQGRCRNRNHPLYPKFKNTPFGFHSFGDFIAEVGFKTNPDQTIHRLQDSKGFVKGNIVWRNNAAC